MRWHLFFSDRSSSESSRQVDSTGSSEDGHVIWTGPSVRIRDGEELLNSPEMKRDLDAARRLSLANKEVTG